VKVLLHPELLHLLLLLLQTEKKRNLGSETILVVEARECSELQDHQDP